MNVNDESDRQLRAAMRRLLDGTPIRSNGSLTVSALAVEAGVSRRTAGRAKGVLRDFQDAIAHRDPSRGAEPNGEAARLRAELAAAAVTKLQQKNAEITRVRAELNTLACRVALLSEENEQLRRASGTGPVVALRSGGKPGS